ncbi:TPA: hypothetical protein ACSCX2_003511 [Aeromonas veronii]|uniref:hypothetical protein n=1 Tax=Aeromonas TaxID=642 RepID=UPI002246A6CF|nr:MULTISPECIES: hypothetical protein [Aeromonas]EKP0294308.1 hypothetical protein [Aeromonas veronii]MCX0438924.1 hypothetical protein [Aeromonas veronii]
MIKNINEIKRDFIRLRANEVGLLLEVGKVHWNGHTPECEWICVKQFGDMPKLSEYEYPHIRNVFTEGSEGKLISWVEVDKAVEKLLNNRRYFRVCGRCRTLNPIGWMHDDFACSGCAGEKLGIVY